MRACDLCRGDAGVTELALTSLEGIAIETREALARADLCSTCQTAIREDGIVDGIARRLVETKRLREKITRGQRSSS